MCANKAKERIGETNYNNQGELMQIIEYNGSTDLVVKFIGTNTIKRCAYKEFKNGHVHDNFYPSVCGIGYIGNTSITIGNKKVKHSYRVWANMILRCYTKKHRHKSPTYIDCWVCKDWHCYANFEEWYNENYYEVGDEKMQLDKDILTKGNKVYSPDNCIFVPQRINALFTKHDAVRGEYPIGVHYSKNGKKFEPTPTGNCKWLGYYDTAEEAFNVYKIHKENFIKEIADKYRDLIPKKLYNALYNYKVEITD